MKFYQNVTTLGFNYDKCRLFTLQDFRLYRGF
ncbi:hypothetical protein HMPREF9447_03630 [Bacteroides oleiciplenus YIT 12058]|uniref:Uncharacterized protein n=1 Tax=Bacteroides oleiciplenus YIT 12058 TaxID=742727 RepID=K9EJH7_9BACE|nr:hypothetical protein HMPREF9447_03630 [Bacteroides oleiciplenus YIT 12058]